MKNKILGLHLERYMSKMICCEKGVVTGISWEFTPPEMFGEKGIQRWDLAADLVRRMKKKLRTSCRDVALVIPENDAYVRRVVMPAMTEEQLYFNLPFEFHDFIADRQQDYVYDYALQQMLEDEGTHRSKMELMAAAVSRRWLDRHSAMLKKCGLRLYSAAPESIAFQNMVRVFQALHPDEDIHNMAFLNLGYSEVQLRVYSDAAYETGKQIHPAMEQLRQILRDQCGIQDWSTHDRAQMEQALEQPACREIYQQIALEIMRVLNFFQYNHPGQQLNVLYCSGGGATIQPLMRAIRDTVGLEIRLLQDVYAKACREPAALLYGAGAVAMAWNQEK